MCGRFAFYTPAEAIVRLFQLDAAPPVAPRYNIAPTQFVPVVRHAAAGRELVMLRWGLVPFWAKEPAIGNRMINARSETAASKPAFRAAWTRRRCAVPADGFYEWQKTADGKQPWFIQAADGKPFAMAGLWERWDKGEEPLETFTILTTAAGPDVAHLHDRMPVILSGDGLAAWLDPTSPADATLMQPLPEGSLRLRAVSKRVNSPANDDPEILEAV